MIGSFSQMSYRGQKHYLATQKTSDCENLFQNQVFSVLLTLPLCYSTVNMVKVIGRLKSRFIMFWIHGNLEITCFFTFPDCDGFIYVLVVNIYEKASIRRTLTFFHALLDFVFSTKTFSKDNFINQSSVIRQKGESQNGCFKKTKHAKFSEKQTFLTP